MRTFLIIFWGVDAFGAPVVTVESYDRLGRLVRQRREFGAQIPESFRTAYMDETGGYELSYAYDADGLRTEFVHPLGSSAYAYDAAGALVRVEYFDSAQPENAWVKVLVTDEGARVRAVCVYGLQDEAKVGSQSAEFASAVEDAQAWLPQCPESVELEGVTLVPVSTSVFSYDGNDSRLLQVSSDGSGSSLTYGAAGFVNSVASWGSADDSAVSFSLLCASTDGRVLAAGGASAGVPEFGVPSTDARANAGSVAGFDASVMHPLVWDENSFVPRVLGMGGSSLPAVGSLVPGAGSGAGLLDPYGWASLGVAAPAVPSAQGASATGGVPVLPDSLVGVSAASGVVLGATGFEVLGARVVDSRVARFTAPDPLAAPVGAGWGADPFSLVGGNPVSLVDPWGLSPVSVEDFEKYREQKASSGITGWVKNNWEYVAGGAMVIAGAVIGAIAAGTGPLGGALLGGASGALMGAGMSVIEDKLKGQPVDWSKAGQEAGKGFVSGAIAGAVTGGLNGLKNIATGVTKIVTAAKAAPVAKVAQNSSKMGQVLSKAGAVKNAVVSKASAAKSALTSYGSKVGSKLNNSKVLEDITKETLSGGMNNVASYYMDDTVKDKSLMGGVGMFLSGGLASAGGAATGGLFKKKIGVKGYVPEVTPSPAIKQAQKAPENFMVRATKKTGTIVRDAAIDSGTGMLKNGIQYSADTLVKGQEFSPEALKGKTLDVIGKDFIKNTIKGSVKMDSKKAEYYRFTAAHTYNEFRVNPSAVISRVASNASERTSSATNRALTWMIGIDISKLKI